MNPTSWGWLYGEVLLTAWIYGAWSDSWRDRDTVYGQAFNCVTCAAL